MIVLLSLLFLILSAVLLGSFFYLGLLGEHPLQALAPNIVTDCFSIAVTLILVEIVIRRHKASKGVEQVGPILLKTLNPVFDFTLDIIKSLHYTPAEFKAIHSAYVDGQLNPIHLPEDFKKRVVANLQAYDINKLEKAAKSVEQTKQFVGQFASP